MPISPATLSFLFENRLHNSRDWFSAHHAAYIRDVITPLMELVSQLSPTMLTIDPHLTTEPRVDRTISRIWRDTRYSRDKSFYRDHMWIIFKRGAMHGTHVPGLYFELNQDGFAYGSGFYHASSAFMAQMRDFILNKNPEAMRALYAYEKQHVFLVEGECYKKPRYPNEPDNVRLWLERKEICFTAHSNDFSLLFSDHLAEELCKHFTLLAPVYRFLLHTAQTLALEQN